MRTFFIAAAVLLSATGAVLGASVVNNDAETRTISVTEGATKSELRIGAGETLQFCPRGCFVTLPNGDLEALSGSETIEISGGVARVK